MSAFFFSGGVRDQAHVVCDGAVAVLDALRDMPYSVAVHTVGMQLVVELMKGESCRRRDSRCQRAVEGLKNIQETFSPLPMSSHPQQ